MIDDIDKTINNSSEIAEASTDANIATHEITRQQILKNDIINQAITTSHKMVENLHTTIQREFDKYSPKNRFLAPTAEWQQTVLDAIHGRRLHMIERANFIIKHKLKTSFN